ncbi:SAF domain-containing protein [Leekyejoonella antrihumi]|nr:SAF domain-containing protein [Leekyejoonella antrihumi]
MATLRKVPQPPRGLAADAAPAGAPGRRGAVLAAVPAQRRTRVILGLVVVAVLGGLLAMVGVQRMSTTSQAWALRRTVQQGQVLTRADLVVANAAPGLPTVTDSSLVVGKIAVGAIPAGTLLNPAMVAASSPVPPGDVTVPVPVKTGQLPARVHPGARVLLVATTGITNGTTNGIGSSGNPSPTPLPAPVTALVVDVSVPAAGTGLTVVDVAVPRAAGAAVAQMSATQTVTIVLLPAAGGGR